LVKIVVERRELLQPSCPQDSHAYRRAVVGDDGDSRAQAARSELIELRVRDLEPSSI
jgi:hypothetical protein